jgi:hypothetical protein
MDLKSRERKMWGYLMKKNGGGRTHYIDIVRPLSSTKMSKETLEVFSPSFVFILHFPLSNIAGSA